ncbi:MAG: XRE family transcriptional regulator [Bacteroidales bacterium]|jgi:SOS-response transcriptional repressor LexA
MEVGERLLELMKVLKLNKTQFSHELNVTAGNLSDWINPNKKSKPSMDALTKLKNVFNVNINWFLSGEGLMFLPDPDGRVFGVSEEPVTLSEISDNKNIFEFNHKGIQSRTVALPISGYISAGTPTDFGDDAMTQYLEIPKAFLNDRYEKYIAFIINGKSMESLIKDGDFVVVKQRDDWYNLSNKIVAIRTSDGITLKKIQFDDKKRQIILLPLNHEFQAIILSEEELEGVSLIGELVMQFRVFR